MRKDVTRSFISSNKIFGLLYIRNKLEHHWNVDNVISSSVFIKQKSSARNAMSKPVISVTLYCGRKAGEAIFAKEKCCTGNDLTRLGLKTMLFVLQIFIRKPRHTKNVLYEEEKKMRRVPLAETRPGQSPCRDLAQVPFALSSLNSRRSCETI